MQDLEQETIMQLVQAVDAATLERYKEGEITFANEHNGSVLYRGPIEDVRITGDWVQVVVTFNQSAYATLDTADDAAWMPYTTNAAGIILHAEAEQRGDRLFFTRTTPRGSTAILSPALP